MNINLAARREFYHSHKDALLNAATAFVVGAVPVGLLVEAVTNSPRIGVVAMCGTLATGTACMEGVMTTYSPEERDAIFIDAFGEDTLPVEAGQTE